MASLKCALCPRPALWSVGSVETPDRPDLTTLVCTDHLPSPLYATTAWSTATVRRSGE